MSVFVTGFPGFIAYRLLKKLSGLNSADEFILLVHPVFVEKARSVLSSLTSGEHGLRERFHIIPGDITREGLGLDRLTVARLLHEVTEVFHLAAVYDLAVPERTAVRINVDGTRYVNQFIAHLNSLKRYVYFSTAYVSGTRTGRVLESELDRGQGFKNPYERSKFEAEMLVQELRARVPTTIIRPAIVVGDSRTGETTKFDGIYFTLRFLERFRAFPIPYIGNTDPPMNVVPVDFISDATAALSRAAAGENKVYHLADPRPLTARQLYALLCRELLGKDPVWTAPASLISAFLAVPWFRRWAGAERETVDYLRYAVQHDTAQADADLLPLGIRCPDARAYLPRCVAFYKQHRGDPERRIRIH